MQDYKIAVVTGGDGAGTPDARSWLAIRPFSLLGDTPARDFRADARR